MKPKGKALTILLADPSADEYTPMDDESVEDEQQEAVCECPKCGYQGGKAEFMGE